MERRAKRLFLIGAVVVALPALAYASVAAYFVLARPALDSYTHRLPFDSAGWKARSLDSDFMWPPRLRMADDLVQSNQLDGLRRRRVEQLLGPPDETAKFHDWDLVYHLGPERGLFRIDSEWLVIRFNEAGEVAQYRIVRD